MSCNDQSCSSFGTCESKAISVIRGSDREIDIRISAAGPCGAGDPFDLSSASAIKALFRKSDETVLTVSIVSGGVSVVSAVAGKIKIILSDTDTSSLLVGDAQSFEVEILVGANTYIVQFKNKLNVVDRVFA